MQSNSQNQMPTLVGELRKRQSTLGLTATTKYTLTGIHQGPALTAHTRDRSNSTKMLQSTKLHLTLSVANTTACKRHSLQPTLTTLHTRLTDFHQQKMLVNAVKIMVNAVEIRYFGGTEHCAQEPESLDRHQDIPPPSRHQALRASSKDPIAYK